MSSKPIISVTFLIDDEVVEVSHSISPEQSLLDLALEHNIDLAHSCGGNATCGTCCVSIESDLSQLPARNELEQEMADDRGFTGDERLACQLQLKPEMQLRVRCKMG